MIDMTTQTAQPMQDTAGIEYATIAAVSLSHAATQADPALIAVIARKYADAGMQAKFRLPDVPAFAPMF